MADILPERASSADPDVLTTRIPDRCGVAAYRPNG